MSPSNFHPPRNDACNNDAAPEAADFDFNRFKIARIEESHMSKVTHADGETGGNFRHDAIQMASFNVNVYANQRHSGCSNTLEDTAEIETDGINEGGEV